MYVQFSTTVWRSFHPISGFEELQNSIRGSTRIRHGTQSDYLPQQDAKGPAAILYRYLTRVINREQTLRRRASRLHIAVSGVYLMGQGLDRHPL